MSDSDLAYNPETDEVLLALLLEEEAAADPLDLELAADSAETGTAHEGTAHKDNAGEASYSLHPVSSAQQRLWFVDQMEGAKVTYNFPLALKVTGPFEVQCWQQAMSFMVQRHHILSATFCEVDGQPMQRFDTAHQVHMPVISLASLLKNQGEEALNAKLAEYYQQEAEFVFDLSQGPLYRLTVLEIADQHFVLLLNMHHIITDGWSGTIFAREMTTAYAMLSQGMPAEQLNQQFVPLPIQYSDYVYWQNTYLQSEDVANMRRFWASQLAGVSTLNLPLDFPRTDAQQDGGGKVVLAIPAAVKQQAEQLAKQQGVSMYMLMLAVFKTTLMHSCKQTDITVGTSVACRELPELEQLIGLFVNQLVLRTQLSGNPTFNELLLRVRQTTTDAFANQKLPFDVLVSEIPHDRQAGMSPLFQTVFLYNNFPKNQSVPNSPIQFEPQQIDIDASRFDLTLTLEDRETDNGQFQLEAAFGFRTSLFRADTITQLSQQFLRLLMQVVEKPEQVLSKLLTQTQAQTATQSQTNASDGPAGKSKFSRRSARKRAGNPEANTTSAMEDDMDSKSATNTDTTIETQTNAASGSANQDKSAKPSRFKRKSRKSVSLSAADIVNINDSDYPTVISANSDNVVLPEWIANNRDMLEQKLMTSGAILFRGFGINTPQKFEQTACAVCPELFGQYGDLPKEVKGQKIYKSTPYPNDKAIMFHNESSHTQQFPLRQMFGSMIVAQTGGETPIVDCRKVYQSLPDEVIRKLSEKKLQYVRNFIEGLDVPWQQFFKTEDKAEVAAYCQANDIEFEWINDKELRTKQVREAVNTHPITGEKTFFNQIQLHHNSYMDEKERESLLTMYEKARLPRNVYYGDGSDLEEEVIALINQAYDDNAVAKLWQEGDFLLVDNMLTAHARLPFEGERKIVVAMGRLIQAKDLVQAKDLAQTGSSV